MPELPEVQTVVNHLTPLIKNEKIIVAEDIIEGIENTPVGLIGLLNGENKGKRLIKI